MRALHTAELALAYLVRQQIVASELLRGVIGEVSNARRAALYPPMPMPAPWDTGCPAAHNEANVTMLSRYASGRFAFLVRPPGFSIPGLISDGDMLWRSDFRESAQDLQARAAAFLAQVFETVAQTAVVVVTHGELIQAILAIGGDTTVDSVHISNGQLVPLLMRRLPPKAGPAATLLSSSSTPVESSQSSLVQAEVPLWVSMLVAVAAGLLGCLFTILLCPRRSKREVLSRSSDVSDGDE